MDPDKLLEEIIEERKNKVNFFRKAFWWATNRCLKCGAKLLLYNKHYKPLKICEWCDLVNDSRILREKFNNKVDQKIYAKGLNPSARWIVLVLFIFAFLIMILRSCGKEEKNAVFGETTIEFR